MARFELYPFIRQCCMYLVRFWFGLSRQVFSFFWGFCELDGPTEAVSF